MPHWKPALTISVVEDFTTYPENGIPPQIQPSLHLLHDSSTYLPVLFVNEFWLMTEHLIIVNETVDELPLQLTFSVTTLMRWMLTQQMQAPPPVDDAAACACASEQARRVLPSCQRALLGAKLRMHFHVARLSC